MPPRVLTLDIETAPATALVFGQWKQDISNIQIIKWDRMIGVGAKWLDEDTVQWRSEYHHGREVMVKWVRNLLNECDFVVHFNGTTFDMPWIEREVAELDLGPIAPVRQVDLCKAVKKQFRYMGHKLERMAEVFTDDAKMSNGGFRLWRDIEVGDEDEQRKAWATMRRYCKQDVVVTEKLYLRLRPYLKNHPHIGLYNEVPSEESCWNPACNVLRWDGDYDNWTKRGFATAKRGRYQRYQCKSCGAWNQDRKAEAFVGAGQA